MAKVSMLEREKKREQLVQRHQKKRQELKSIIKSSTVDREEKIEAIIKLQKLPVNSSRTRLRSRCKLTGRPRGVYKKFGLCRNKLREAAMRGDVPGLKKASW